MKSNFLIFTGLFVAGSLLQAQEIKLVDEHFLSALRIEAARKHPSAIAAKFKSAAAGYDVRAVRLWNDPKVGLGFMAAERAMRADEGDVMLSLEQPFPKPGMFEAQRRKAEALGRAELQNSRTSSLAAGAEAARSAIEVALADESISLQQSQIIWITAMTENAKQMAAGPMGSSTDALRMETELAKENQMLDAARRSREGYAQKLNLTLGRPLDARWPTLKLPATPPPVPLAQAEIARIPYVNPRVRAMREMVGAANAETRVADRERQPEFAVAIDTRLYSAGDIRSTTVGVTMNLPWLNDSSYQAKVDAAKNRELAAGHDVETLRREVAAMVLTAVTEATNAAAQARAYSGEIHEKAIKATQTTEAAWISSKTPLTDLLDSSRSLFSIRLEQRRFTAMQLAALEELQTLVPNH